jgi:hypothetical protein
MKLLDEVMVKRPETCDSCPFGSYNVDEGSLCCGCRRDTYTEIYAKGERCTSAVKSPKDALEHECECMFIKED